jgi:hypothetical protein
MNKERELLRRAVNCLLYSGGENVITLSAEIQSFLASEPEDEPVAWFVHDPLEESDYVEIEWVRSKPTSAANWKPLYTRPEPERKPISQEEADKAYQNIFHETCSVGQFWDGIRFAEKYHGIGVKA